MEEVPLTPSFPLEFTTTGLPVIVTPKMPAIKVPTLVLAGAKDVQFLAATDYMAAMIPGAEKVIIEGAGHAANIDKPEAFNQAVRAFLDHATA